MIAALYVAAGGTYYGLADVEPWGLPDKDARLYAGPWPVVAHPPCERWGRYFSGGPSWKGPPKIKGDDGGCFVAALAAVRKWGGVLEHPEGSSAWEAHGLMQPGGGWSVADWCGGWTCRVEQGHFGHRARKGTWLYAAKVQLPSLPWGASSMALEAPAPAWVRCGCCPEFACTIHEEHVADCPCPPIEEWTTDPYSIPARGRGERSANDAIERMGKRERAATPPAFRDLLIGMARSAQRMAA